MEHAFAQIEVRAKNTNTHYNYKIKGVRFGHVPRNVNLNLATLECSKVSDDFTSFARTYDTPVELDATVRSIMGNDTVLILPPHKGLNQAWDGKSESYEGSYAANGSYISVLMSLTSETGTPIYPAVGETDYTYGGYGWACIPVDFNWESGKKYIYTLDFSTGAGQVGWDRIYGYVEKYGTFTMIGWSFGDYILGGSMKFKAEVEEWSDPDSTDVGLN